MILPSVLPLAGAVLLGWAQTASPAPPARSAPPAEADGSADRMAWWREARFGLFLHWGLYAVPAGVWGDEDHHGEWIMNSAHIPVETYEGFLERFDPVRFDADRWAAMAADAGMRYVVITTKHHDGFALFDSSVSDYDVMATPFRRDVMAELAAACRRHGLRISWYHSIMDWHHPDYLPRRGWETRSSEGADFERYVAYLQAQVTELLTRYGEIGVMWFDGEWEATWNHRYGRALYELCRELQPSVIVNNRVDVGRAGMAGMTSDSDRAGDFGTPEQTIPAQGLPGVDWETCMTMNRNWGFNAADRDWKSSAELIEKLVDIASKGGNFLLNVGPRADGTFPPEAVERLAAIGDWMDVNGEAIHGTRASPVDAPPWGRVTSKARADGGTTLYLHVLDWPEAGLIELTGIGNAIRGARLLAAPDRAVEVGGGAGRPTFRVGSVAPDPIVSVLRVDLEGAPLVYRAPEIVAQGDSFLDSLEVSFAAPSAELGVELALVVPAAAPGPAVPWRRWDGDPLTLTETTTVRARSLHDGLPVGGETARTFTRVEPLPARDVEGLEPGLRVRSYRGEWDVLPDFLALEPASEEVVPTADLPEGYVTERVARVATGYLEIPETGLWTFVLESDDGSRLLLDDELVVDNDGLHGPSAERGTIALAAGFHALSVEWFNKTGGATLALRLGPQGGPSTPVPPQRLAH